MGLASGARRLLKRLAPLLLILLLAPGVRALVGPEDPGPSGVSIAGATIPDLLVQIQAQTLLGYVSALSGATPVSIGSPPVSRTITTRYSDSPQIEWAAEYVLEYYRSLGISVEVQRYAPEGFPDKSWPNVIAEIPGAVHPDQIVLICAHLDDTSTDTMDAPGADDNASGTAAVMAAAAIMRQYEFENTVRFAHFTGEEQMLYGSKAYAQSARARGDNIVAVLNLDMIAWDSPPTPTADIYSNTDAGSQAIAAAWSDAVATYSLPLEPVVNMESMRGSDHASFWDAYYPAVLVIEDYGGDFNPYYHSPNDTIAAFNVDYFVAMTRASLATLARYANLQPLPPPTATPQGAGYRAHFPVVWVEQ